MISKVYMRFRFAHRLILGILLVSGLVGMPQRGWPKSDWSGTPRTALVIVNGSYAHDPLETPLNDARDMARTLRELGFEVIKKKYLERSAFIMTQVTQSPAPSPTTTQSSAPPTVGMPPEPPKKPPEPPKKN